MSFPQDKGFGKAQNVLEGKHKLLTALAEKAAELGFAAVGVARADGHTDIVERTSHELRLDPVLYWLPMARWVVDQNNARVLAHIRRHAEQSVQH